MFNHPVISADGHIDLPWLPPTLFTENAPAALKDKMPKVVDSPEGKMWLAHNGVNLGLAGGMGSAGGPDIPGENHPGGRRAAEGLDEDFKRVNLPTGTPGKPLGDA